MQKSDDPVTPSLHGPVMIRGGDIEYLESISGAGSGTPSDPYVISDLWINGSVSDGISINGSEHHIVIEGCAVTNGYWMNSSGIGLIDSSNVTIRDSLAYFCENGIRITNCMDISLERSSLIMNSMGLLVENSSKIKVDMTDCSHNMMDGIHIENCSDMVLRDIMCEANSPRLGSDSGAVIHGSSDILIDRLTCELNYGNGLAVFASVDDATCSKNISVTNSRFDSNVYGLHLSDSDSVRVSSCKTRFNTYGIHIGTSEGSVLEDCSSYKNSYGIYAYRTSGTVFKGFRSETDDIGMVLDDSHRNMLEGNWFINNTEVMLEVGLPYDQGAPSGNNVIVSNRFVRPPNGLAGVIDNGPDNQWHVDGRGNYWSFIQEPDHNGDGVVDSIVMIPGFANSMDEYPLVDRQIGGNSDTSGKDDRTRGPLGLEGPDDPDGPSDIEPNGGKEDLGVDYTVIVIASLAVFCVMAGIISICKRK